MRAVMRTSPLEFYVLGVGHLAAAVRVQLPLFGLTGASDERTEPCVRRVILACSDYESASSFADANRRAVRDGCAHSLCMDTSGRIEVGPLVVPSSHPASNVSWLEDGTLVLVTSRHVSVHRRRGRL